MRYIEEKLFDYWITQTKFTISRPDKYSKTINTITKELKAKGYAVEDLFQIKNVEEAKALRLSYMADEELSAKNKKGNNMYSRSFDLYIEYLEQLANNEEEDIIEILKSSLPPTEKQSLILTRIGQGKYREGLIKLWGRCSISKFPDVSLLVASHIKPWSKCLPKERIDPYNGFLLLPNYDKVFDKGLITFDGNWRL
ncbi:HNH endonuclease [Pedobacter aquatilis]|uniref:HNH endonuclease n=1 Tax=Pedobacter aquatilis TaxID=351343 RepID=UPI00292D6F30|nr:HNH endonuclease [Pedobacter aquatilis]